jgi:hypothetical protein
VVGPGGIGQKHLRGQLLLQKLKSDSQRACSWKALGCHHPSLL